MTQVIHGLTREQLVAQVFKKPTISEMATTIVKVIRASELDYRDSRSDKGGKKGGGGF